MADNPPAPPSQPAVRVTGLDKSFGSGNNRQLVLKNIELEARFGEILMLVGPSGCGKTTLLSIIAGTLNPDKGDVSVLGQTLTRMRQGAVTKFRAENVGFIFQQFHLIPTLSIAQNVSVPLLIRGMSPSKAERLARESLAKVGLADRYKERPTKLSGGQQQRVAIARALVHEPRLIICDEPTAALDAKNGTIVMQLFEEAAVSPDRCVIIVTHDNRIFHHAHRIAAMDDGQIVSVQDVDPANPPDVLIHHKI